MKTNSLISVGLGLLALCGSMNAQQNYYHFDGAGLNDHGYGNEVIQTTSAMAPIGVVVAGAAFDAANAPQAFLAKYDNLGNAIFHRFFRFNAPGGGNVSEAVGVVEANSAAVGVIQGFGVLCYTSIAPAQTVLVKTDLAGNFLWKREIGTLRGASVAYDATLNRFLCLTQVFANNTNQLHLVVVDANTGVVIFNRFIDGCGNNDSPVTVIHDVLINEYVCLGNSRTPAGDNQLMLARVTPGNVVTQQLIFGNAGQREIAVDLLRDPAFNGYIIGGYIPGVPNTPFFASIDMPGAVSVITLCQNLLGNNTPRRMALINNLYMMVGTQVDAVANVNGFFVSVTNAFGLGAYRIYGQPPAAGSEELRDISPGNAATPTLMCGTHQRTVAWLGSAANLSYNWLVFANNVGAGTCPQTFPFALAANMPPITPCALNNTVFAPTLITQINSTQLVTPLDECLFPNIAQPDPTPQQARPISSEQLGPNRVLSNGSNFAQVYPNPASDALQVAVVLEKGTHGVMELFDMTGRAVRTETLDDQSSLLVVNVADLPEGVYFCRIHSSAGILTEQKVVVKH